MQIIDTTRGRAILAGIACFAGLYAGQSSAQGTFGVVSTWEGIKACTGSPITGPSPRFTVSNVPAGAVELEFRMVDLDAPRFNHGGGKVRYTGDSQVAPGAFQFIGPCPPNAHRYEWTVTARDAAGKSLGVARATKNYP